MSAQNGKTADVEAPSDEQRVTDALLGSLIGWAGDDADVEDCRSAAAYLTPVVAAMLAEALREAAEDSDVLAKVKWRLDHYGPFDAEPFRFSRYESPAHAALSVIADRADQFGGGTDEHTHHATSRRPPREHRCPTCENCMVMEAVEYRAERAEAVLGRVVHDLNALADYHETSAESITPSMLRSLAGKYRAAIERAEAGKEEQV